MSVESGQTARGRHATRKSMTRMRRFVAMRVIRPGAAEPPFSTAIGLGLAALTSACLAVVAGLYRIGPDEPQVWLYSHPVASAAVVLLLVALSLASWSVGIVAVASKHPRAWLAALVLMTCGVSASVFAGASQLARAIAVVSQAYPSFRVSWDPVPAWMLTLMLATNLTTALCLVVPARRLMAIPVLTGLAASVPVWMVLALWALLPHGHNEIPIGLGDGLGADNAAALSAPRSSAALRLFSSSAALGLTGWLVVLILLSGSEFAKAQISLADNLSQRRVLRNRNTFLAAASALLLLLVLGFIGLFGQTAAGDTWHLGVVWQWLFAGIAAVATFLTLRWEAGHPIRSGHLRGMLGLTIVVLSIAPLVLVAGSIFHLVFDPLLHANLAEGSLNLALRLHRYSDLAAVVLVGGVSMALWRAQRRTTGTIFGLAFAVWALPDAIQIAVRGDAFAGVDLLASPQRLSLFVCLGVVLCAARTPYPSENGALLSKTLLASVLIAFSIAALAAPLPDRLVCALLVILPVVWRFVIDTKKEQERPASQSVLSMATWATLLGIAAFTSAPGSLVGLFDNGSRVEWNLLIVPLALTLLCQVEPDAPKRGAGWRGLPSTEPVHGITSFVVGAATAALIAATAVAAVREVPTWSRPAGPHATITSPLGWTPVQCDLSSGDIGGVVSHDQQALVLFAHADSADLEAATPTSCPPGALMRKVMTLLPDCHRLRRFHAPANLRALSWHACSADASRITYGVRRVDKTISAVVLLKQAHATRADSVAAEEARRSLIFG
jgi:hypothetical protein